MVIGFIGTGNMGGAILKGYVRAKGDEHNRILIHNRTEERNRDIASSIELIDERQEFLICKDNKELAEKAEIIIVGVKPNGIPSLIEEIGPEIIKAQKSLIPKNKIIVSMAAGVSIGEIEDMLNKIEMGAGNKAKIVRVMPNTPAQVCCAMTSISKNSVVTESDFLMVKEIFDSIGQSEEVEEDLIHCVIGVSGSSTAYTYMYIEALMQAAVDNGMSEAEARVFAAKAVSGAAEMVLRSSKSLEQLRVDVCSPNGTTIEAVHTLQNNGFMEKVKEGFQAAVDRSKEMTDEKK